MTFFFMLNPKQFIDPSGLEPNGDAYKPKKEVINAEALRRKEVENLPQSPELKKRFSELSEISQKIDKINPEIELEKEKEAELRILRSLQSSIAKMILLMAEEEELLLFMFMHEDL